MRSRSRDPDPLWPTFAYFWLEFPAVSIHTEFQVSIFSHSRDKKGFQNLTLGHLTPPQISYDQLLHILG